ncbi:hypothetical protein [Xenophilus sp. Marseille-Q4582]|uniref:hypothetical protein n=1 Tax=Xenophilus sp. Marseille-Q4582 TaxID=2866600 RepID=UPI001CE4054F|nr:hypothetical protein [Xenophilus sp. Marseille-Q4582]
MARILSEQWTGKKSVPQPASACITLVPITVVLPAAVALNDIIALHELPPGVELVDYDLIAPQLDSNATPTATFSLGVENAAGTDLATVYEAGLEFGRTAGGSIARATAGAAAAADATTARRIALKVTAAFATYAGSGKTLLAVLHLKG